MKQDTTKREREATRRQERRAESSMGARKCAECPNVFTVRPTASNQKYCSTRCANAYDRRVKAERLAKTPRVCVICSATYFNSGEKRKTCSDACSKVLILRNSQTNNAKAKSYSRIASIFV